MKKTITIKDFFDKILIIFLLIQPIFDLKIFYNSISTLIRVIIIFAVFFYYFFSSKNNKKYYLLIYPCLIGIYFIFHHFNALHFKSLVPGNFNYSLLKESLYFVKMLSPFLLIYSLYKADFEYKTIINIIKYLVLIFSIVIVVSNIFCFSYGSYSDEIIKANFFEWFNPNTTYSYQDLASKGLFEFGNQIAAVLIMFLPFIIHNSIKNHKILDWIILSFNLLALILLCTKVSVLGVFVVFVYTLFSFGFIAFIRKKYFKLVKQYIPIACIFLVYCVLLPFNPMFSRVAEREALSENTSLQIEYDVIANEQISNSVDEDAINSLTEIGNSSQDLQTLHNEMSETEKDINYKLQYIENNYENKKLHKQFLFENYPYKYDLDFWYNFLQNDITLTTDYRYIETSMVKRVIEINNCKLDKWFGITNTRLQNLFNVERDFVVQYYALGIIGVILIFAPYFVLICVFLLRTFKNKFNNLNIINLLAAITILFMFGVSYFTGNLFNSLSFTIYFSLLFIFFSLFIEHK